MLSAYMTSLGKNRATSKGLFDVLTKILDFLYSALCYPRRMYESLSLWGWLCVFRTLDFCVMMAHVFRERFSTLCFSYTTNVSSNVSFSRIKTFFLFFQGRRSLRGSTQNPWKVSYWIISCSDVSEGSERQKSATCREHHFWLYENYLPQLFVWLFMFIYESCFAWLNLTVRRNFRESIVRGASRRSK